METFVSSHLNIRWYSICDLHFCIKEMMKNLRGLKISGALWGILKITWAGLRILLAVWAILRIFVGLFLSIKGFLFFLLVF